jgi:periplasmic glucans biosynthesis protein
MHKPNCYVWLAVVGTTVALWLPSRAARGAAAPAPQTAHPSAPGFGFETVGRAAEQLAARPYAAPKSSLPKAIASLSYDEYRDIRFKPEAALWRKEKTRFQVQFFHLGFFFTTPVEVNVVVSGHVAPVRYDAAMFDFGKNAIDPTTLNGSGFAGLRVHYPMNTKSYADELLVFLGASYFRVLGRAAVYGASARGLAIDTAEPTGEEFPAFRTFWLEQPARDARQLTIYALLDSRSMTGAYRFVVHPGSTTTVDVTASLFAREQVHRLGVAPITSMFLFGKNSQSCRDDFRPEVHDSDGLVISTGAGEQLFRPLDNPARLTLMSFEAPSLKGFGLVQRDRAFSSYEDLEAHYERRPDVFIEPVGDWGAGTVVLLELPSPEEIHDNVTAFWAPAAQLAAGATLTLAYRISWGVAVAQVSRAGRTLATRIGAGSAPGLRRFVLDFAAGRTSEPGAGIEPVVSTSRGRIVNAVAQRNDVTGDWRVAFELALEGDEPAELRCFVRSGKSALTETWSYLWTPRPTHPALWP